MPSSLETKDPTLAVVIERLSRLSDDFAEHRRETKQEMSQHRKESMKEIEGLREEIQSIGSGIGAVNTLVNKARGGWFVIIAVGGLLTWGLGILDKVFKAFPYTH
ncbi:hypothetical protein SAMN05216548_114142 [Faunimonas pinastri]|uniref:Uncharacterized protein n=1 Tax=Faunimonas pinastri TaxID=1855383 RepID=A0A1H9N1S3_9HYPH|nr:hypothetical protein [Faunimonas pinastri]SER29761.1 hypothetical protein SAMN05216548_114142 [Faunimonas pinastri]